MNNMDIRFTDSNYKDLFSIPNGGQIKVTLNNGEEIIRNCKYIDDYHFDIDGHTFHMAEYAELMERNGNKYEPITPLYELENVKEDETEFVYADDTNRGEIGHYRGDFGRTGNEFYANWFDENKDLKSTDMFNSEFIKILNYFHQGSKTPILSNINAMNKLCNDMKATEIKNSHTKTCMFKVITDKHTYYFRCMPQTSKDYNFYIYCYKTEYLQKYKDLQVIDSKADFKQCNHKRMISQKNHTKHNEPER